MAKDEQADSPVWIPTKTPGLYKHRDSLRFYSRALLPNGSRPYVSLKTKVYSQAVVKHQARLTELERKAVTGQAPGSEQNLKTLGDVTAVLLRQLDHTQQTERTKKNYRAQLAAVKEKWPVGDYDTFDPRLITFDVLLQLRTALKNGKWEAPAGFAAKGSGGAKRTGVGYSNRYINASLARFKNVIELARHYGLMHHDPFLPVTGIHGGIWLPLSKPKKDLPTLEQMKEVFRLMAGIPVNRVGGHLAFHTTSDAGYLKWRLDRALDSAEHSEFLAYAGCRLEEANVATFEDLLPPDAEGRRWVRIHGTKTSTSDRTIPAFDDLTRLFERIRQRREKDGLPTTGRLLRVKTSRQSLATACETAGVMRMGHHTLRHYFATLALSLGVPVQIVADWMGHKDKGITLLNTYTHVIREQSASYAGRLSYASPQNAQSTGA